MRNSGAHQADSARNVKSKNGGGMTVPPAATESVVAAHCCARGRHGLKSSSASYVDHVSNNSTSTKSATAVAMSFVQENATLSLHGCHQAAMLGADTSCRTVEFVLPLVAGLYGASRYLLHPTEFFDRSEALASRRRLLPLGSTLSACRGGGSDEKDHGQFPARERLGRHPPRGHQLDPMITANCKTSLALQSAT